MFLISLFPSPLLGKLLTRNRKPTCSGLKLVIFVCFLRILVSVSTKSKYSILKLSFGYLKQHCCMGITLLTKEITPKNIVYRNEIQYRDDVPTKTKVGM